VYINNKLLAIQETDKNFNPIYQHRLTENFIDAGSFNRLITTLIHYKNGVYQSETLIEDKESHHGSFIYKTLLSSYILEDKIDTTGLLVMTMNNDSTRKRVIDAKVPLWYFGNQFAYNKFNYKGVKSSPRLCWSS
jgi:hypothetical protein